jgi:hypothetical protein
MGMISVKYTERGAIASIGLCDDTKRVSGARKRTENLPIIPKIYSVTAPVLGPIPPALVHARGIEHRLPEQRVHLVVHLTEPRTENHAVTHVWQATLQALPEILCAVPAQVELR